MEPFVINAVAPTRICDVGGWTDTHFARHGAVFNVAIYPYVEVQVHPTTPGENDGRLIISTENFGTSYELDPAHIVYDKHPLIEAAIKCMALPRDIALRINIFSYAPPGASMGTSAAVSVALIGALAELKGMRLDLKGTAAMAHALETKELGLECGVQDQLASAHGGINLIEITNFPNTAIQPVPVSDDVWWELEHRLLLTYIGKPHESSAIHKMVIAGLGAAPQHDPRMERLRQLAHEASAILPRGDFAELGRVFNENTAVQRALHPNLICAAFEDVISVANHFHAMGCKVNGAGGDGGSIAILTDGDMFKKRELQKTLEKKGYLTLPVYLSRRGLRVWRSKVRKDATPLSARPTKN